MIIREDENGVETISEETLLNLLDTIEAELWRTRADHDCLPTPDHIAVRHLLVKLGRRSKRVSYG